MRGGTTALVVLVVVGMTGSGLADDGIVRQLSDLGGQPYNVSYNNRCVFLGGSNPTTGWGITGKWALPSASERKTSRVTLANLDQVEKSKDTLHRSMLLSTPTDKDRPVLLLSGSVHYVRSTPEMWPSIFAKLKASGLNAVESYVFWNFHVHSLEAHNNKTVDYTGRGNVTYVRMCFVPWCSGEGRSPMISDDQCVLTEPPTNWYVCAEWPGGGMPSWLGQIPGMKARSATQPYQDVCYDWMHRHIEYVRPYFAENGGPVIITQMENELSGPSNTPYVEWLGELATQLRTNLPWIMCHGAHANDTIETCNGCDCTDFVDGIVSGGQPAMWSEDEQWFDRFSQGASVRPTGNVGRGMAAFIAAGGSMHNFYMFHGGTMWGNWSSTVRRTRLTPSYANTANLASDSIIYDPKYSTIAGLHYVLQNYTATILHTPVPITRVATSPTTWHVTMNGTTGDPTITFLFNDGPNATTLPFRSQSYAMAAESSRVLDATGSSLWYSKPDVEDGLGQPYHLAFDTSQLKWTNWVDGRQGGSWYKTSFPRPSMPDGAMLSVNLTGFGQGNMFLNGVHVNYFDLTNGECFHAPGGVNNHGSCLTYLWELCDTPTQSNYHVPPEWIADENEMLVFSRNTLPTNITTVDPTLASVVYRMDPSAITQTLEPISELAKARMPRVHSRLAQLATSL